MSRTQECGVGLTAEIDVVDIPGLDAVGAKRVAVSTAYSKIVNDKITKWLQ